MLKVRGGDRIDNPKTTPTIRHLKKILDFSLPTIQFSEATYSKSFIKKINSLCKLFGPKLEIRFYGHYNNVFDASILEYLPDVQKLSIDCLQNITNISFLYELKSIKHLSFGVFNFDDVNFLSKMETGKLKELRLGKTKKCNIDLSLIPNIPHLNNLSISGHTKGIENLGQSKTIHDLSLRSIPKKKKLEFVSNMSSLVRLMLILGGRKNINEIALSNLEELKIVRMRGFNDLGNLTRFPNLRDLEIEDQFQLSSISLLGVNLDKIKILNCKKLQHVGGLEFLTHLEHFRISGTNLDLEKMCLLDWPKSLKTLALYSGQLKRDRKIRENLDSLGYKEF